MRYQISFYGVLLTFLLTACAGGLDRSNPSLETNLLHDTAFPDYEYIHIETKEEIFTLSDEAKAYVDGSIHLIDTPIEQMRSLVTAIFDHSRLDLLYISGANTVADETFKNRAANCLSMSIMTYSMASYAGFHAEFQDIEIPEYWTRREGYSLLNGHINVDISPPRDLGKVNLINNTLEVDFDPQNRRNKFKKRAVGLAEVMSMFYNNKAVDALLVKDYVTSYAYLRQSLALDADHASAWVNLGLLYRHSGMLNEAEKVYKHALAIEKNNPSAIENLAHLYRRTGRIEDANRLLARVDRNLEDNPYYHFIRGEQDFENEEYEQALSHYRDALRLDKSKHEIYFGLAKVYYVLGDINRSQRYFREAKRKSTNRQDQNLYQGKLDLFSSNRIQDRANL